MTINLTEERLNRGLSLRGASKEIGISGPALARAEAGESIHPGSAKAIADFYGSTVTEIWPIKDDPAPVEVGRVRKVVT